MPIYEYRCATCGYQNEYLQRVSEPLLTDCPECHKPTFKKMVSAAGFQLKGTGWYATDFKTKSPKAQAEKDDNASKAAEKPAEKSSEKPSEKTSEKPAETKKDDTKSAAAAGTGASPASS